MACEMFIIGGLAGLALAAAGALTLRFYSKRKKEKCAVVKKEIESEQTVAVTITK